MQQSIGAGENVARFCCIGSAAEPSRCRFVVDGEGPSLEGFEHVGDEPNVWSHGDQLALWADHETAAEEFVDLGIDPLSRHLSVMRAGPAVEHLAMTPQS